jgi:hypothetical protein
MTEINVPPTILKIPYTTSTDATECKTSQPKSHIRGINDYFISKCYVQFTKISTMISKKFIINEALFAVY